jgi:DNA-binding Lrp family transcriptional regulator
MDKIDVAIIRELTQGGLVLPGKPGFAPSYREVSMKIGIPFTTVSSRINLMYKLGVLRGSFFYPNPNLFKLNTAAYTTHISEELDKADAFRKLKSFDAIISAHDFLGRMAWITFVFSDEQDLERKLSALKKIAGAEGILSRIPFPPCTDSFSKSEALLMLHLTTKGLESYAGLARNLETSTRTLVRRMSKIAKENMILSIPNVDYSAMEGSVPADLLFFFANEQARATGEPKILELVKDYVIFGALFDIVGMCSLILPNAVLLKEIEGKVKQIDGVMQSYIEIVVEHFHQPKILAECLEKEIQGRSKSNIVRA